MGLSKSDVLASTKLRISLTLLLIIGSATTLVVQHRTQRHLREEIQPLRQETTRLRADNQSLSNQVARAKRTLAPRLPVPPRQVAASTNAPVEELPPTHAYARLKNKPPKLTSEQVESYLKAHGRKAANLLAAYRTSRNQALLREAIEKYPADPQVAFEAVFDKELPGEQRRQWLNAFKESAPDNALANYLSAREYFNAGQTDLAVQELNTASTKPQFENYTLTRWIGDEEAYLSAGYSEVEAKFVATSELPLPQLAPLKQLGQDLVDLANVYNQSGDPASAQAALAVAVDLGQRYVPASAGDALISQLVGLVIQRNALRAMEPDWPYGNNGQTVGDQLDLVEQQREALKGLSRHAGSLLEGAASDQDWINYIDRWMIFGDLHAAQWLVNKYGQ